MVSQNTTVLFTICISALMFEPNADRLCRCKKIAKIKRPQFLVVLAIRPRGVGADDWRIRTQFWELRRPWRVQCAPCGADKCARRTLLKQHRTTFTKCRSFSFVKCLWEKKSRWRLFSLTIDFVLPFACSSAFCAIASVVHGTGGGGFCDERVCPSGCLFVCVCLTAIISPGLQIRSSTNFLCMLPMAVVRSPLAA